MKHEHYMMALRVLVGNNDPVVEHLQQEQVKEELDRFLKQYRKQVIEEVAEALGKSGDYYIEQGEQWVLSHYEDEL